MALTDEEREDRAAERLLWACIGVAVVLWSLLGWVVVTPDAPLTAWGRSEHEDTLIARGARRLYAAEHAARSLERDAVYGDRPVVFIVGSSITREAFDLDALRSELAARGSPYGVEKYAIDRGAPFFTWAMTDAIDLRPGDRVITSVAVDNFRRGWLDAHNGLHPYLNFLPRPRHIMAVAEMPLAERLDYALAAAPPHRAQRDLPAFRDGVNVWLGWLLAGGERPEITEPMNVTGKQVIPNFREQARWEGLTMSWSDLGLDRGEVNHDALLAWHTEVVAAGAEPWVLYLPPSPEYGPRYLADELEPALHAFMRANVPPYAVLPELPQDHYTDYKHLNNDGRALMTSLLVELLVDTPSGEPIVPPAQLVPRPVAQTEAMKSIRRDNQPRKGGRRRRRP